MAGERLFRSCREGNCRRLLLLDLIISPYLSWAGVSIRSIFSRQYLKCVSRIEHQKVSSGIRCSDSCEVFYLNETLREEGTRNLAICSYSSNYCIEGRKTRWFFVDKLITAWHYYWKPTVNSLFTQCPPSKLPPLTKALQVVCFGLLMSCFYFSGLREENFTLWGDDGGQSFLCQNILLKKKSTKDI